MAEAAAAGKRGPCCTLGSLAELRQVAMALAGGWAAAAETTGAVHPDAIGMLYAWHAEARVEGCLDRTVYGASRTATTSFFTHHLRLISLAAERCDRRGAPRRRLGESKEISPP